MVRRVAGGRAASASPIAPTTPRERRSLFGTRRVRRLCLSTSAVILALPWARRTISRSASQCPISCRRPISAGRWAIVRRRLAYEKDRIDAVDPSAALKLDADLLSRFPEGYRHLAYLQSKNGFKVKTDLPGLRGPAVERMYADGKAWLAGSREPGQAFELSV